MKLPTMEQKDKSKCHSSHRPKHKYIRLILQRKSNDINPSEVLYTYIGR